MDDALTVDVNQSLHDLAYVHSGLEFSESLSPFGQILEGVVPAVLQQDINILFVLEGIYEFDYVAMPQRFVYLNFDEQLIPLSFFVDALLGNDLSSQKFSVCAGDSLVALRKASSSKQLALNVGGIFGLVAKNFPILQLR